MLTFDGSSCVYEGSDTRSPGPVDVVYSNRSEEIASHAVMQIVADGITLEDVEQLSEADPDWNGDGDSIEPGGSEMAAGAMSTMPDRTTEYTLDLVAGTYYFVCMYNSAEYFAYGGGITVEP